jgi:hypothetical protein
MTSGSKKTKTATVRFSATIDTLDTSTLVRLPEPASRQLPSAWTGRCPRIDQRP